MARHSVLLKYLLNCYCIFMRKYLRMEKDKTNSNSETLLCWQSLVLHGITADEMVDSYQ